MSSNYGDNSQEVELNLAPIIDCFTVLITFMLASASFLSLGILDAGVAAAGSAAVSSSPPPVNVTIELKEKNLISFKLTGKESRSQEIVAGPEGWNYVQLSEQLKNVKSRWPEVSAVTLFANDSVEYKDIVQSMEQIRKTLPVVMLGGF